MMWVAWCLSGFVLLAWILISAAMLTGARRCGWLDQNLPDEPSSPQRLSVVVPARNEEASVEPAMRSLLALDYPDMEVIAVDDRSEDHTGAILDRLAAEDIRLRVVHVHDLPEGWLGKTNALQAGGELASGEWILFTDADVIFAPDALRRAVHLAQSRRLDHLALFPNLIMKGFWESLFLGFFGVMFCWFYRPWEASDPHSRGYVGMGAFNLVRTDTYRLAGGHIDLRLAIVDDVELGHHLKMSGAHSDCQASGSLVRVRWLQGLGGAVRGLTKNTFAGMGFRPAAVIFQSAALVLISVWPAVGLFVGAAGSRGLCIAAVAGMMISSRAVVFGRSPNPLYGLGYPLAGLIFAFTMWRSMFRTYRNGGVIWRGTLYPLDLLRGRKR